MDIHQFRQALRINKHRLDDELEVQPQFLDMISQELAKANSRLHDAAEALKRCEAQLYAELKEDNPKLTEKGIEAEVKQDKTRRSAFGAWQAARFAVEEWQGLYEAWKSRGFTLRTLSDLYTSQYFSIDSTTGYAKPRAAELAVRTRRTEIREASLSAGDAESKPRRRSLSDD